MAETAEKKFEVPIPSAVKRQVELGKQKLADAKQGKDTAPPAQAPAAQAPQPDGQPAQAAPAQSAAPAPLEQGSPMVKPDQQQAQPPAAPAAQQQQPQVNVQQLQAMLTQAQQALSTLQGKYDSEVPTLIRQNRELTQQVQTLQTENQQLKADAEQTRIQADDAVKYFSDEVSPEYAQNLVALVRGQVDPISQQFKNINQQAEKTQKDLFWEKVEQKHPDWKEVNKVWLQWLVNPMPPLMEESYDQALQRGMNTLNADVVIRILDAYKAEQAAGGQQQGGMFVLPEGTGGGGNPAPEKRTYNRAQVAAFYNEKNKLSRGQRCMYTPDQAAALEQDIIAAGREGRITG